MTHILTKKEWREVKVLLQDEDRNVTEIAKKYGVSRTAIYSYAWNRKWLVKSKEGFFKKVLMKFGSGKPTDNRKRKS